MSGSTTLARSLLLILCLVIPVRAQPPVGAVPADALAYASLNAGLLGTSGNAEAQRAAVNNFFDWLGANRLLDDSAAEACLRAILAGALVHARPVSLCVFHAAESEDGAEFRFRGVLSIDTGDAHAAIVASLDDALSRTTRTALDIPGLPSAVEHRSAGAPAWRSTCVVSAPGRIDIGLGEGRAALVRWFAFDGILPERAPLSRHRAATDAPNTRPLLELYIDLNQLRRAFPARFGDDAAARLLAAFHLANARSFMLHVRRPGAAAESLAIDATWSVRSEPDDAVRRLVVAHPVADASPLAAHLRPDWPAWVIGAVDAYAAIVPGAEARDFARARRTWASRRLPILSRVQSSLAETARVTLERDASGVALGAVLFRMPIKDPGRADSVTREVRAVLDPFAERISTDTTGRTYWLQPAPPSPLRAVSWGTAPGAAGEELVFALDFGLLGDWVWHAVENARAPASAP